jgi:hypothetical protein
MPRFRERLNYVRPPSRTRRRRFPAGFGAPVADSFTDTDVLLSLPPQTRRAIIDRREGRF